MNIKEIFILFLINLLTLSCYNNEIYQNDKIDITSSLITPSPIISQSTVNPSPTTITAIPTPLSNLYKEKIVFMSNRDGNYEIYVMDSNGNNQTRLTNNDSDDIYPIWSPDGKRIAFLNTPTGSDSQKRDQAIYVMDADGTNQTKLTSSNFSIGGLYWSPDSKKIAFSPDTDKSPDGYNWYIYVVNVDGSNLTELANARDLEHLSGTRATWGLTTGTFLGNPNWSPDNKKIAFIHKSGTSKDEGIYIINADGTNQIKLNYDFIESHLVSNVIWFFDGKKIVFGTNSGIYIMNSDGSNQTKLTPNNIWGDSLVLSPDGNKVAFSMPTNSYLVQELYVLNVDGTNLIKLSSYVASLINWFPDNKKIIFVANKNENSNILNVYTINSDGSNRINLNSVDDFSPICAPDGKKILFVSKRDGNNEIYIVDIDGSNQINLTNNPADDSSPSWIGY